MKALSIRQPWASLIVSGGKDVENRDWPTRFRGRFAIHSSAKVDKRDIEDASDLLAKIVPNFSLCDYLRSPFPGGAILGTADLHDCVEASRSPWFAGRFGFVLRNVKPIASPIQVKGALGFWDLPPHIAAQIDSLTVLPASEAER